MAANITAAVSLVDMNFSTSRSKMLFCKCSAEMKDQFAAIQNHFFSVAPQGESPFQDWLALIIGTLNSGRDSSSGSASKKLMLARVFVHSSEQEKQLYVILLYLELGL